MDFSRYYILTLAGSIFFTSGYLFNEIIAAKEYWVFFCLSILFIDMSIREWSNKTLSIRLFTTKQLELVFCLGIVQSLIGVFQSLGLVNSNSEMFRVTGSYDNPAGIGIFLALIIPLGLFLVERTIGTRKRLIIIGLFLILFVIILTGSRASLLASFSSFLIWIFELHPSKSGQIASKPIIRYTFFLVVLLTLITTYFIKRESADGRILIWIVSLTMIKENPLFGLGSSSFSSMYMNYQAEYFRSHPDSRFVLVADQANHPFNEFIKVAVEYGLWGVWGLTAIIIVTLYSLRARRDSETATLGKSAFVSIILLSTVSYPLKYISTVLICLFYLLFIFNIKEIHFKTIVFAKLFKLCGFIIAMFLVFFTVKNVLLEVSWQKVAKSVHFHDDDVLETYQQLYTEGLYRNPYFLYNYGAVLSQNGKYDESNEILIEYNLKRVDYNSLMLEGANFANKKQYREASSIFIRASNMIPSRFMPLYNLYRIKVAEEELDSAFVIATQLAQKPVKVPSFLVSRIKAECNLFIEKKNEEYEE